MRVAQEVPPAGLVLHPGWWKPLASQAKHRGAKWSSGPDAENEARNGLATMSKSVSSVLWVSGETLAPVRKVDL
jgi:hypothetical protein